MPKINNIYLIINHCLNIKRNFEKYKFYKNIWIHNKFKLRNYNNNNFIRKQHVFLNNNQIILNFYYFSFFKILKCLWNIKFIFL